MKATTHASLLKRTPWHPGTMDADRREHFMDLVRRASPGADPTSVMLFGQMMRASRLLEHIAERELETSGLTWAKFRLLLDLHRSEQQGAREGMQPSELSEMQNVSRNTVSALIASLEKDGLISRELHGTDRRRFVIRLTHEGRRVLHAKLDRHFRFVTHCFDHLDAAERETLLQLLSRLNQKLCEKDK